MSQEEISVTTSPKTAVATAIESPISERIPAGILAYITARSRGAMFDYVHQKLHEAERQGMTRKELANRIGKSPTRLSHILGSPGNWTIDTVSELLVGIAGDELLPASRKLLGQPRRNFDSEAEIKPRDLPTTSGSPSDSANSQKFDLLRV